MSFSYHFLFFVLTKVMKNENVTQQFLIASYASLAIQGIALSSGSFSPIRSIFRVFRHAVKLDHFMSIIHKLYHFKTSLDMFRHVCKIVSNHIILGQVLTCFQIILFKIISRVLGALTEFKVLRALAEFPFLGAFVHLKSFRSIRRS